jgi:hypothetical protein
MSAEETKGLSSAWGCRHVLCVGEVADRVRSVMVKRLPVGTVSVESEVIMSRRRLR